MNLLVYLAIILVCAAVWYLTRIFELASEMRGDKQYEIQPRDNKLNGRLMLWFMFAFFAFCIWQYVKYKDALLPVAASEEGVELDWLLDFNFIIIIFVFLVTNFFLFYFAWKYAGAPGRKATYYPENHRLELIWTVIPGLVLAVIIFLGLRTWNNITREPGPEENFMVVELYAEQFQWTSRYSGDDNILGESDYKMITPGTNKLGVDSMDKHSWDDFLVADTLHLMVNKRVKFVLRSQDVIHSAFVPHFRQQMNCVPGMRTQMHFVPTITTDSMRLITGNPEFHYILLCNKICGAQHYNMQRPIIVEDSVSFMKWYEKKKGGVIFASKAPKKEAPRTDEKPMGQQTDSLKPEGMSTDTLKK